MSDFKLSFGVLGGSSISSGSGGEIKKDLDSIVAQINATPFKIDITAETKSFKDELDKLTSYAKLQAAEMRSAYDAALKGVQFPKDSTGGNGNGGGGGSKAASVLEKDTTAYYKAVTRLEKMQTSVRESLRKWSQAENGSSSKEYKNLEQQEKRLIALGKALDTGRLKSEQFEKFFSKVTASVATSANEINFNEENHVAVEKLRAGVEGYDQALKKASSELDMMNRNLAKWTKANETGSKSGQRYAEYENLANSVQSLIYDLNQGKLTTEEFENELSSIRSSAILAANAIKSVGEDTTSIKTLTKDTKEYNDAMVKVTKQANVMQDNLDKWTMSAAPDSKSNASYQEYKSLRTETKQLELELTRGNLTLSEFSTRLADIKMRAEKAFSVIHKAGEDVGAVEKLRAGVEGYDQALISVNSKLVEVRKNLAAWSAAANGDAADDYSNLQAQELALEELKSELMGAGVEADKFAQRMSVINRESSQSAEAIKRLGMAFEDGADIKEYNSQLNKVNDLLVSVKKNLNDWSSAKTGNSSSSYRELERTAQEVEGLRNELLSTGHALDNFDSRFDKASSSAKQFATDIKLAGENTKSVKGQVQNLMRTLGISFTFADAFHKVIEIGREMVEVVTEVDVAMTELKKVTDEADSTYARFLENARGRAHGLGATIAETVNATADFARLGHGITDASSLADAALVYKNVGDGIEDISTASESIISAMQAFGIEAKDAMSIIDAYNITGNKFAISSGGVGEALSKSASALAAGNNTMAESIALITSANTTIQNTAVVGTAMKSISMFLRASKTEAEEAGESTEGMANSVSELRDELLALTGQKVDIQLDEDTYKSTYQIISEIAKVWDQLTDINRANILELIGGKRNANVTAALIENFDIAKDVIKEIEASSGSALRENEIYLDSISGRITQLKSSLESLSTSVLSSELVKWVVSLLDGLTQLATVISDVAFDNFFTTLSTLTIGGGAFKLFKDLD